MIKRVKKKSNDAIQNRFPIRMTLGNALFDQSNKVCLKKKNQEHIQLERKKRRIRNNRRAK